MSSAKHPLDEARDFYGSDLLDMIHMFLTPQRYIYSGDDFFVLAYPYRSGDLLEEEHVLLRHDLNNSVDKTDTWVIHFFSGDIKRLFEIAPFDLDYVAFERRGKWKLYNTEDLKRRT